MANPFDTVHEFERAVAAYAGAPYGIATDCCSNAIFLCAVYWRDTHDLLPHITLPRNTYVSVPMQMMHAGYSVEFADIAWEGTYTIEPTNIVDAAPRFRRNMYIPNTYHCVSFQFKKILSTIKGGMILTDDNELYQWAQKATHDGRDMSIPYEQDRIRQLGYHMFMTPETAQIGLDRLANMTDWNADCAGSYTYPDISYVKGLK